MEYLAEFCRLSCIMWLSVFVVGEDSEITFLCAPVKKIFEYFDVEEEFCRITYSKVLYLAHSNFQLRQFWPPSLPCAKNEVRGKGLLGSYHTNYRNERIHHIATFSNGKTLVFSIRKGLLIGNTVLSNQYPKYSLDSGCQTKDFRLFRPSTRT